MWAEQTSRGQDWNLPGWNDIKSSVGVYETPDGYFADLHWVVEMDYEAKATLQLRGGAGPATNLANWDSFHVCLSVDGCKTSKYGGQVEAVSSILTPDNPDLNNSATDLLTVGIWGGGDDAPALLRNLTCMQSAVKSLRMNGIWVRTRTVTAHGRTDLLSVREYDCTDEGKAKAEQLDAEFAVDDVRRKQHAAGLLEKQKQDAKDKRNAAARQRLLNQSSEGGATSQGALTETDLNSLKVPQLQQMCTEKGVQSKGNKPNLVARLLGRPEPAAPARKECSVASASGLQQRASRAQPSSRRGGRNLAGGLGVGLPSAIDTIP